MNISPWLFTTYRCNLKCSYCHVHQMQSDMSKLVYTGINNTFVNLLRNNTVDYVTYRVAGGEPLLVFDQWKSFVKEFINKSNGKGSICILTNLTFIPDGFLDFLNECKDTVSLTVSLDGFTYSKPFPNGNSTADNIKKNIDKLLESNFTNISVSTVICPESFYDIVNLSQWISKRSLKWSVNLNYFFCGEINYKYICNNMIRVIQTLIQNNYDILSNFRFGNINLTRKGGCTAGKDLITICPNGDLYPCQTSIHREKLGNILDDDDILSIFKNQKTYNIGYNYTLPDDCQICSIKELCSGGCKLNHQHENRKYTCNIIKTVILYIISAIIK